MIHDWSDKLRMLVENATGVDLNGDPGKFNIALYQLISEAYRQPSDEEDTMVLCVLLKLHEAIKGEIDLRSFAEYVVNPSVILIPRKKRWIQL